MKILNFGSLNIDYVYSVNHIVQPGETIASVDMQVFSGGKGLNQSVALARAGAKVYHAGLIGKDGELLLNTCEENGIDTTFIRTVDERCGNAIIQLASDGQNSIILFGGANLKNEKSFVDEVLSNFGENDMLLLQNEINLLDYIIDQAHKKKMIIALNPSPFNEAVAKCDLSKISVFLMNEIEAEQITGKTKTVEILEKICKMYPNANTVLTLGKSGVAYQSGKEIFYHGVYDVPIVDTTAAGDTFTGYFINAFANKLLPQEAIRIASRASSLAVSIKGATSSIPMKEEVELADLKPL